MAPGDYQYLDIPQNVAWQPTSKMAPQAEPMRQTYSNDSYNSVQSNRSNFSNISATSSHTSFYDSPITETSNFFEGNSVDPSKLALDNCEAMDDFDDFYTTGHSEHHESTHGPYLLQSNQNILPTPSSLGWDETVEPSKYYELNVENLKEPYLQLRNEYVSSASSNPSFPMAVYLDKVNEPVQNPHPCRYPGHSCWKDDARKSFRRPADLDRHYKVVHKAMGYQTFLCDHPRCNRHGEPFTRRDHARDHYRDYHKEDLGAYKCEKSKATNKAEWAVKQQQWKSERVNDPRWWRCSKCLDRVWLDKNEWCCPRCTKHCEESRIEGRIELANTQLVNSPAQSPLDDNYAQVNADMQASSLSRSVGEYREDQHSIHTSSYPSCLTCGGYGFLDGPSAGQRSDCYCPSLLTSSDFSEQTWESNQY